MEHKLIICSNGLKIVERDLNQLQHSDSQVRAKVTEALAFVQQAQRIISEVEDQYRLRRVHLADQSVQASAFDTSQEIEELRARLRGMPNLKLQRFGREARLGLLPGATSKSEISSQLGFEIQLNEVRAELQRRRWQKSPSRIVAMELAAQVGRKSQRTVESDSASDKRTPDLLKAVRSELLKHRRKRIS